MKSAIFKKTWKTETAWIMLAWLFGSISWIAWNDPQSGTELIKASIAPVITFAGVAILGRVYQNTTAAKLEADSTQGWTPNNAQGWPPKKALNDDGLGD